MARLAEPSLSIDTIESLRRRFIRQNREIARANSTQSIRIRTLEAENAQLLSDNLVLRKHAIELQQECDRVQARQTLDHVTTIQKRLETGMAQLGALVTELTRGPLRTTRDDPRRRRSRDSSTKSITEKPVRFVDPVDEFDDGRLPSITEGKLYPRRTFESAEIRALVSRFDEAAGSPDLGPPPVAHFESPNSGNAIATKEPGVPFTDFKEDTVENISSNAFPFEHLETRRKRRPSSAMPAIGAIYPSERGDDEVAENEGLEVNAQQTRSAVKQMPASEGHLKATQTVNSTVTDVSQSSKLERKSKTVPVYRSNLHRSDSQRQTASPQKAATGRRALGEKSVNTDPVVSPVKGRPSKPAKGSDEDSRQIKNVARARSDTIIDKRSKTTAADLPSKASAKPTKAAKIFSESYKASTQNEAVASVDLQPITPAAGPFDLFSPDDSSRQQKPAGTPPPSDLQQTDTLGGRPSRRQRSTISYAEPNLRDKMRRPTKEFVDAVGSATKGSLSAHASKVGDAASNDLASSSTASGPEAVEASQDKWEAEGAHDAILQPDSPSPLEHKSIETASSGTVLPRSVLTERRRRSTIQPTLSKPETEETSTSANVDSSDAILPTAASKTTIATLAAGSSRRLSRAREAAEMVSRQRQMGTSDEKKADDPAKPLMEGSERRHSSSSVFNLSLDSDASQPGEVSRSETSKQRGREVGQIASTSAAKTGDKRDTRRHSSMVDLRGAAPSMAKSDEIGTRAGNGSTTASVSRRASIAGSEKRVSRTSSLTSRSRESRWGTVGIVARDGPGGNENRSETAGESSEAATAAGVSRSSRGLEMSGGDHDRVATRRRSTML